MHPSDFAALPGFQTVPILVEQTFSPAFVYIRRCRLVAFNVPSL
jgi:hypothetical protein